MTYDELAAHLEERTNGNHPWSLEATTDPKVWLVTSVPQCLGDVVFFAMRSVHFVERPEYAELRLRWRELAIVPINVPTDDPVLEARGVVEVPTRIAETIRLQTV